MQVSLVEVGQLLESLKSSFDLIVNRPAVLHSRTLLVITSIQRIMLQIIEVKGYIAEFLIDGKVSVIPTGQNDALCLEEILIPEQEFVMEIQPGQGAKFIKFCGRNL